MILLAIFCLFLGRMLAEIHDFQQIPNISEGQLVTVTGIICKKEFKGEDGLYYLKHARIAPMSGEASITANRVIVRVASTDYRVGEVIQVSAKMRWMETASNTGGFDERKYYHSLGISSFFYTEQLPFVVKRRHLCPIRNGLSFLRQQMRMVYVDMLNEKDAGILSSMVLGDKSLMEDELKQLYSSAGISHILAVSGLHVSIVGMTLFQFLRKHRQRYVICCSVSGVILLLFCVMSGMSVSAMRAGIMFLIFLGAQFLGRKYNSLRALLVAAVITLMVNPSYIYNAGFLFSYFAVFGAVAVAPRFVARGITILQSIMLSGAILLTTLPLTAYFYYEIPVYSILANLIVIPLAGVLMGFGLLGGLFGCLGGGVAWILFIPCHGILRLYEGICEGLRFLPADVWITGRPPLWLLILYYGVLVFLVWFLNQKEYLKMDNGRLMHLRCEMLMAVPIICMLILFTLHPIKQFQISFLDVGQGDGIYINGGDGRQYFIDGGSTSEQELGRYTILPFLKYHRVRQIDVWFVSHADTDHISGLLEALECGYAVDTIVISKNAPEDENLLALKQAAVKNGTDVVSVGNGASLQGEGYRIVCYTPESLDVEDRNQASLVNMIEIETETKDRKHAEKKQGESGNADLRILLTGDIGMEQEEWMLSQAEIGDVDILKAAHHGSKYSNSQTFLETLSPELTIISCGENNLYGHPHEETLERLEGVESDVLLTMEAGEITIYP